MAKQTETFFDFDMTKFLADLRIPGLPGQGMAMPTMPVVPGFEALADAQKRNMETVAAANKLAFEGMQAILRRQGEMVRGAVEDATAAASRLSSTSDMQQRMALQAEMAKDSFERTAASMRELSELFANSNAEVVEVLNHRVVEAMDELSDVLRNQPLLGDAGIRATVAQSAAAEAPARKANGAAKAAPAAASKPTAASSAAAQK